MGLLLVDLELPRFLSDVETDVDRRRGAVFSGRVDDHQIAALRLLARVQLDHRHRRPLWHPDHRGRCLTTISEQPIQRNSESIGDSFGLVATDRTSAFPVRNSAALDTE